MPRPPPCHTLDPGMQARVLAPEGLGLPCQPSSQPEGKRSTWRPTLVVPRGTMGLHHADRHRRATPQTGDVGTRSRPGGPRSALPTTHLARREDRGGWGGTTTLAGTRVAVATLNTKFIAGGARSGHGWPRTAPPALQSTGDAREEEGWCKWRVEAGRDYRQNSF